MLHDRLCRAVGDEIAEGDVDDEARQRLGGACFALERKGPVEQVAQHASEDIVGRGREPVTQVQYVVKHEHDPRPNDGVDRAHQQELPEGAVKVFFHEMMHGGPPHKSLR